MEKLSNKELFAPLRKRPLIPHRQGPFSTSSAKGGRTLRIYAYRTDAIGHYEPALRSEEGYQKPPAQESSLIVKTRSSSKTTPSTKGRPMHAPLIRSSCEFSSNRPSSARTARAHIARLGQITPPTAPRAGLREELVHNSHGRTRGERRGRLAHEGSESCRQISGTKSTCGRRDAQQAQWQKVKRSQASRKGEKSP
ncbi:hypothetical protein AOLI_G00141000 [Acnodon oligacanthus]